MKKSLKAVTPSTNSVDAQLEARIAKEIAARIAKEIEEAMKPAEVRLTVKGFVKMAQIAQSGTKPNRPAAVIFNAPAQMDMDECPDHPRVFMDKVKPNTLHIKAKGATIILKIAPDNYYPIGVAFKLLNPDETDATKSKLMKRIGRLNFETTHMPGTSTPCKSLIFSKMRSTTTSINSPSSSRI